MSLTFQSKRAKTYLSYPRKRQSKSSKKSSFFFFFCSFIHYISLMKKPLEFNTLPEDLIFDIFSRVSLKTLCRSRCVCKKWLFFLNLNQEFTSFYHQKHKISPLLMFTQQSNETPSTQLSYCHIDGIQNQLNPTQFSTNFPHPLTSILTCNGTLCLITDSNAFLYDPITKHVLNVPSSAHLDSTFSWGIGHVSNPYRNLFKLIHFYTVEKFDNFHYCQVKELRCEVIATPRSDIGSIHETHWRCLGKCPFDILGRKQYAQVGGKMYWLIGEKKFNPYCIKIMSFDLSVENFGVVCFSKEYSNRSVECLDLVEIKGRLCLTDRLPWETTIDIWMMRKGEDFGYDMWVKKYRIDLVRIEHHDVRILGHLSKDNDEYDHDHDDDCEGEILINFGNQSLGLYDLQNGVVRDLAGGVSMHGWDLKLLLKRIHL